MKNTTKPAAKIHPESQEILELLNLTFDELKEYSTLKKKFFGTGITKSLFVILDEKLTEVQRYNELAKKVVRLHAFLIGKRNSLPGRVIDQLTV